MDHILGNPASIVQNAFRALSLEPLPPYGEPSVLLFDNVLFDLDAAIRDAALWLSELPHDRQPLLIAEEPHQPVTVPLRIIQGVSAAQLHVQKHRWIYANLHAFGHDLDDPQVGDYAHDCARFVQPFLTSGGQMVFSLHERAWDHTLYLNPKNFPNVFGAPGAHRFAALARYANEAGLDLTLQCILDQRWVINRAFAEQILSTYCVLLLHFDTGRISSLRNTLLRAAIPHHIEPRHALQSSVDRIALFLPVRHRAARIVADWLIRTIPMPHLFDATAYLHNRLAHLPGTPAYTIT